MKKNVLFLKYDDEADSFEMGINGEFVDYDEAVINLVGASMEVIINAIKKASNDENL